MKYKWAIIVGAILGMCSCTNENPQKKSFTYQIQGIDAYRGQSVASLFDANGAPNKVNKLGNNREAWIYYTNYRPLGGGELISFNNQSLGNNSTGCTVEVILENAVVQQVFTDCK